jgi:deoxyribose-phosphate aldolase
MRDGKEYHVASICCRPADVASVAEQLKGSDVLVGTVVRFPHGSSSTKVKVFETALAVEEGALRSNMVINIGYMKSGTYDEVREEEIAAVVEAAAGLPG